MSRGPGRWQRVILNHLETEEGSLLVNCLWEHLQQEPTHTEYSTMCRAATLLAKMGRCHIDRVWGTNSAGTRAPLVWVCRLESIIPRRALTLLEKRAGYPEPR
jgi:hypothetical protein